MNYGKIAEVIALGIAVTCSIAALIGVAVMWIGGAPLVYSIPVTLLVAAVGSMILFGWLELRQR